MLEYDAAWIRSVFDFTLPLVALLRGRRLARKLQLVCGERRIEDLWLPYVTAELYIRPPVEGLQRLDCTASHTIVELGYDFAKQQITAWKRKQNAKQELPPQPRSQ